MLTARRELKHRVDALRRIRLFSGCTFAELSRVDRLGVQIDVRAGRVLTREHDAGNECFVVLDGTATAQRADTRLGRIGPSSIAGEMALLYGTLRTATVVADTSMRVLVLDAREFKELLEIAPGIRDAVDRVAAERLDRGLRHRSTRNRNPRR